MTRALTARRTLTAVGAVGAAALLPLALAAPALADSHGGAEVRVPVPEE